MSISTLSVPFRIVVRDEAWSVDESGRVTVMENRLGHGEASGDESMVHATDRCPPELIRACEDRFDRDAGRLRDLFARFNRLSVRLAVSLREIAGDVEEKTVIECSAAGLSIITTPDDAEEDVAALLSYARLPRVGDLPAGVPVVWRGGTSAVLLHEAAGHPSEIGSDPLTWPAWLRVVDAPAAAVDDLGERTRSVDLLRGEPPSAHRRETFRDLPLPRMSRVIVSHVEGPAIDVTPRIEVFLVAGGSYDPLTGQVTMRVTVARTCSADGKESWLRPFTLLHSRHEIAAAIRGAHGEPQRYPGVICSREGQDLYVETRGCELVTVFA